MSSSTCWISKLSTISSSIWGCPWSCRQQRAVVAQSRPLSYSRQATPGPIVLRLVATDRFFRPDSKQRTRLVEVGTPCLSNLQIKLITDIGQPLASLTSRFKPSNCFVCMPRQVSQGSKPSSTRPSKKPKGPCPTSTAAAATAVPTELDPQRRTVQRGKTFTGCWTCRERGVKCDERRPLCARCERGHFTCKGYHNKLVWLRHDNDETRAVGNRRAFLDDRGRLTAVFETIERVNQTLELLDGAEVDSMVGPFGVYALPGCGRYSHQVTLAKQGIGHPSPRPALYGHVAALFPSATTKEAQLLHNWASLASGVLVNISVPCNPFRDVFLPLAASASGSYQDALLQTIFALESLHEGKRRNRDPELLNRGLMHHTASLGALRKCLEENGHVEVQVEVTVATIIALALVELIRWNIKPRELGYLWKHHLDGGGTFLRTLRKIRGRERARSPEETKLCQLLLFYDTFVTSAAFSSTPDIVVSDLASDELLCVMSEALENSDEEEVSNSQRPIKGCDSYSMAKAGISTALDFFDAPPMVDDDEYILLSLYGVSKPTFLALLRMRHFCAFGSVTQNDVEALEQYILANKPPDIPFMTSWPSLSSGSISSEAFALRTHQSLAFHYATLLLLRRLFLRIPTPHPCIKESVSAAFMHLEQCLSLERTLHVPYQTLQGTRLWPAFVAACEAEGDEQRERVWRFLGERARWCHPHTTLVEDVVWGVWNERDEAGGQGSWWDWLSARGREVVLM